VAFAAWAFVKHWLSAKVVAAEREPRFEAWPGVEATTEQQHQNERVSLAEGQELIAEPQVADSNFDLVFQGNSWLCPSCLLVSFLNSLN